MFEPRALPAYATIVAGVATVVMFLLLDGFSYSQPLRILPPLWGLCLLLSGPLARRISLFRIGGWCEATSLIYCQGGVIAASLPMIAAHSGPLADDRLVRMDHALYFDWYSLIASIRDYPSVLIANRLLYMSFLWQAPLVLLILFSRRNEERAWTLVNAAAISVLACVVIFPFFPAVGGFMHYGISRADYSNLHENVPWQFGQALLAMRAGVKVITPDLMVGYVSFPSYHAASALLLAWAMWSRPMLRWFFAALNVGMALSALVIGAHYLVDLLAGAIIAYLAIIVSKVLVTRLQGRAAQGPELSATGDMTAAQG